MVIVKNGNVNLDAGELISWGFGYRKDPQGNVYKMLDLVVSGENFDESQLLDASSISVTINGKTYSFDSNLSIETRRTSSALNIHIEQQL